MRLHRASDDSVAGGSQQITLISDVPINRTSTGGEPFGQGAKCETAFSAAVQKLDRRFNDLFPRERFFSA